MSDVKDILGIGTPKKQSKVSEILEEKRKTPTIKEVKPEGVSREVFALRTKLLVDETEARESGTPIVPVFKKKRKLVSQKKAEKWELKPFKNSARDDGATFVHWVKATEEVQDYKFAKLNKKLNLLTYTDDEYQKYLHFESSFYCSDKDTEYARKNFKHWEKQETDILMKLAIKFDTRFAVIHDIWLDQNLDSDLESNLVEDRCIEELKYRFYYIQKQLIWARTENKYNHQFFSHPLLKFPFNLQYEIERKNQSLALSKRSKSEVSKSTILINEHKRIEDQNNLHFSKRVALLESANGCLLPELTTLPKRHRVQEKGSLFQTNTKSQPSPKRRKKSTNERNDTGGTRRNNSNLNKENSKEENPLDPNGQPIFGTLGVNLTGSISNEQQATLNAVMLRKVDQVLNELNIGKPAVNTYGLTSAYNELKQNIGIFLELQKFLNQKLYQVEVIRNQIKLISNPEENQLQEKDQGEGSKNEEENNSTESQTEENIDSGVQDDTVSPPNEQVVTELPVQDDTIEPMQEDDSVIVIQHDTVSPPNEQVVTELPIQDDTIEPMQEDDSVIVIQEDEPIDIM